MSGVNEINEHRREAVRSLSAVAGMAAVSGLARPKTAAAQDAGSDLLPNGQPRATATGEPAVVNFERPFDMSDPREAWYAKIKVTNNLAGEKTYVPMFSRA